MSKKPVCTECKSDDIWKDANAVWNNNKQEWELLNTFDNCWCNNCDGECKLEWVDDKGS